MPRTGWEKKVISKRRGKPGEEPKQEAPLRKGQRYCPLSAVFATTNRDAWLIPEDVDLGMFDPLTTPEELRGALEKAFRVRDLRLDVEASDTCLCAFTDPQGGAWLVTWDMYSEGDQLEIWADLARALLLCKVSKLLEARIEGGRVLVHLGYRPVVGDPKDLVDVNLSTRLLDCLAVAHRSGLLHGGINQRWISVAPHPNLFGFGLAALYAAWRHKQNVQLGLLGADPRFASPDDLMGEPPSIRSDRFSLAALITAGYLKCTGQDDKIPSHVQGGNSFLDRIARSEAWVEALQLLDSSGKRKARRKLAAAFSTRLARDPERRWWAWQASILVLAVLAGGIGDRLVAPQKAKESAVQGPPTSLTVPKSTPPSQSPAVPVANPRNIGEVTPPFSTANTAQDAAAGEPHAMTLEDASLSWLSTHGKELRGYALACGSKKITGLLLGGNIPTKQIAQFTTNLYQSIIDGSPGSQVVVERIYPLHLQRPVLLVVCGP
jgi:hypothetical protein